MLLGWGLSVHPTPRRRVRGRMHQQVPARTPEPHCETQHRDNIHTQPYLIHSHTSFTAIPITPNTVTAFIHQPYLIHNRNLQGPRPTARPQRQQPGLYEQKRKTTQQEQRARGKKQDASYKFKFCKAEMKESQLEMLTSLAPCIRAIDISNLAMFTVAESHC